MSQAYIPYYLGVYRRCQKIAEQVGKSQGLTLLRQSAYRYNSEDKTASNAMYNAMEIMKINGVFNIVDIVTEIEGQDIASIFIDAMHERISSLNIQCEGELDAEDVDRIVDEAIECFMDKFDQPVFAKGES